MADEKNLNTEELANATGGGGPALSASPLETPDLFKERIKDLDIAPKAREHKVREEIQKAYPPSINIDKIGGR